MDLLIQVASRNGISPAGNFYLKAVCDRPPGYIQYKPSTAVGRIGCQEFFIVPKSQLINVSKGQTLQKPDAKLPFEVCFT